MRGVNIIPKKVVSLADWHSHLEAMFSRVWIEHSAILAKAEGHADGALNEIGVEDGDAYVGISDRPTTIREYELGEIEALRKFVGEPKQFFAVDYTDEGLLRRVLTVLVQREGRGRILVEDERSSLAFAEDFVEASEEG